ncbi:MAG: putative Ig domain-containing protein [Chitinispirillales bacterium]|jgi:hypothetical protein|nr:putative Ig domain-containing protein [Chitinispirillales bacterium]
MSFFKGAYSQFPKIKHRGQCYFKASVLLSSMLLSYHPGAHAKIINATGGTTTEIQTAVNQASAAAGDTVKIPAGTFTFNGSVTMNAGITVLGAGKNSTVLNKSGSSVTAMFVVNGSNGYQTTIGGFTISGIISSPSTLQDRGIQVNYGANFHIFDVKFKNFGHSGAYITGNSRGLIRHCDFIDIYRPAINNLGYGVAVYGDKDSAWTRPLELGTANAVYIEDCYFSNTRHAVTSNDGGKYVFRYNTIVNNAENFQGVDVHGLEYGSSRGSRSYEIYNNIINDSGRTAFSSIWIRGGDGVIFNNKIKYNIGNDSSTPIILTNRTDGTHNSTTYPAPDQTRMLYVWDNEVIRGNNVANVGVTVRSGHKSFFMLDRDYFHEELPGYTPYTYPHPLSGDEALVITANNPADGVTSTNYFHMLTASGGTTPYTWSVISGALPAGLNLNGSGIINGTLTDSQSGAFIVKVADVNNLQDIKPMTLSVINSNLVNLINSSTYSGDCGCIDSRNPVTALWNGNVSGNPQASMPGSGTSSSMWVEFDFGQIYDLSMVRLFGDADSNWVSKTFSVFVKTNLSDPWTPVVNNQNCFGNQWYQFQTTASGRYMRLFVMGDSVKNSVQIRGFEAYGELNYLPPAITTVTLPGGETASGYSHTLTVSGGRAPYTWSVISGALPAGLSLSGSGIISGIPVKVQTSTLTIRVMDANNNQDTVQLTIPIVNLNEVNLINASTYSSDCGLFASGNTVTALWNGNISGDPQSSMPGSRISDSIWVEFDFGQIYSLSRVLLFGDANGDWVSKIFDVYVKQLESDQWTQIVKNKNCFGNQWYETETIAEAQYLRLFVKGDSTKGSVQVRAFEVYGEPKYPYHTNLINGLTYAGDCGLIAPTNPVEGLWDGNISGDPQSSMPGSRVSDTMWIDFNFGQVYDLSRIRLFGDTLGDWVSKTFSVFIKSHSSDPWIQIINKKACFGNRWYESLITAQAQYLRLFVKGDSTKNFVQVRAFEVYGAPKYQSAMAKSVPLYSTGSASNVNALTGEFTAGPNPVAKSAGTVNFYRQGTRVNKGTLTVFSASGKAVSKVKITDKSSGQSRRMVGSWNFKDTRGRPVSEGTYLVKGMIKTSEGKTEEISLILGVR